ncbi:hypothetical protein ACWF8F_37525, partial [Streptomyces sp. NPDC055055]
KREYAQYEHFHPAHREHAPDAAGPPFGQRGECDDRPWRPNGRAPAGAYAGGRRPPAVGAGTSAVADVRQSGAAVADRDDRLPPVPVKNVIGDRELVAGHYHTPTTLEW